MATAVIVVILIIVCVIGVRSFMKKLAHGCCGAGGDDGIKVKVTDTDPSHYPFCTDLKISGMKCKHCKERVENALNLLDGVWAEVDLETNSAKVHMKKQVDEGELRRAVAAEGYAVER